MQTRTWTFGERLKATVLSVKGTGSKSVVVLEDEVGEGHIIVGVDHDVDPAAGQAVVMEFTKASRTDGFWIIVALQ